MSNQEIEKLKSIQKELEAFKQRCLKLDKHGHFINCHEDLNFVMDAPIFCNRMIENINDLIIGE